MILRLPYCLVSLTKNRSYSVALRHYEELKDAVERKDTGWVELDLFECAAGKALVRLPDIVDLGYFPQDWIDVRWEQKQEAKLNGDEE